MSRFSLKSLLITVAVIAGVFVLTGLLKPGLLPAAESPGLEVAEIEEGGALKRPSNLDQWVFLGASLGMGYAQSSFDPDNPGMFQVVLMEPQAYDYFLENRTYADGSMFALYFYGSENQISINRSGFVMGDLHTYEIHLRDSRRFKNGSGFYIFGPDDATAGLITPSDNACTQCHDKNGAFESTFVQFYPTIRSLIPEEDLARALEEGKDGFE